MKSTVLSLCLLLLTSMLRAQAPSPGAAKADTLAKAYTSTTTHTVTIDGKPLSYQAVAGTMLLRNMEDEPIALFGYTAYYKTGVADARTRPITFVFNGGPGSASIWLHLGVMGPKRVVVNDPSYTPAAPYTLEDNPHSLLDVTDIVMMDPIGTGLSRAVGKAKNKDFWGVDPDIQSCGMFIRQFVTEQSRWNSPKFVLGESYGGIRGAGLMRWLLNEAGMALNGVIFVSPIFDYHIRTSTGADDLPYVIYLPSFAATAWYHNKVANRPASVEAFIDEARAFAKGDYAAALAAGDRLDAPTRARILERLSYFTGLSRDYLDRARLRVTLGEFRNELLRDQHLNVGRLDSRFTGITQDLLSQNPAYDPQSAALGPPYTALFMDYLYGALKVPKAHTYHTSAGRRPDFAWEWKRGSGFPSSPATATDMAEAMSRDPNVKVLILAGLYDLATPFFAMEHSLDHLELEPRIRDNFRMKYYPAGHMMYTHLPSLVQFKRDVAQFILDCTRR